MSTDFQMNYHHNKDNLHVKMQGILTATPHTNC